MKVQKNGNIIYNLNPLELKDTQDERSCFLISKHSTGCWKKILYFNIFLNYEVKCVSVNIHSIYKPTKTE